MLNEEEKKYLSSTRLSIKINYEELEENYDDGNIFYHYGKGIIISTVNSETYIDKKMYKGVDLINLLGEIFLCIDTNELILPEEFFKLDIINQTFANLHCNILTISGIKNVSIEQLEAIEKNCDIKELKVPDIDKNTNNKKFKFKIIPNINSRLTSEKFKNFLLEDILRFKVLNIELPLSEDYIDNDNQNVSESSDLDKIIDILVDIDSLSLTILDDGSKSIKQVIEIITKIEVSIGSKIENIYVVTGNRNIENIELLKQIDNDHKLSIMYDKEIICSLDDFIKMRNKINLFVTNVKKYELSPLEKTLYIYDMVKDFYIVNHKYMKDKKVSRYLHRIFKNNQLNCQAYSALFSQILREVKIHSSDYTLYSPLVEEIFLTKDNHSRTIIYLNDKKYNINGLFNADVIWDAIKKMKKNYHYEFFLTRILNIKKQFSTDKFHNDIELLLGNKHFEELSEKEKQVFERLLNKTIIKAKDIQSLREIIKNNISLKDFLQALSSVRVAQGRDKKQIKEELVAIVNRNNKNEKFIDKFQNYEEDLNYLDITL